MKPLCPLRWALEQPDLLASTLGGPSWLGWRALLISAMGEALTDEERETFRRLTGREREPLTPVDELWGIIGRRGGKSRAIAALVVYLAILVDHAANLVVGERGVCLVLASNVKQARVVFNYVLGILESIPAFAELIINKTMEVISLSNGIDIEIRAASFRGLRGVTCVCAICDEIAYWLVDEASANPDREILDALRPTLATTGGLLACIGSPYARRGEMWRIYRRDFGPEGDPRVLVMRGASRDLNPLLPQAVVDRAFERDAAAATAEYLAEFRSDIEMFVSVEAVEAAVARDVVVRAPILRQGYVGFVDPSGGSSDSMTMAIAHKDGDRFVLDVVLERKPPFSPDSVVREFAAVLKGYRVGRVVGDRYAGEWPREAFRRMGVVYEPAEKVKSDIYLAFLPLLNSGRVDLLDNPKLVSQLCSLERRTARGGRDSIDHAPGAHDDVANAAAGALVMAMSKPPMRINPKLLERFREPAMTW